MDENLLERGQHSIRNKSRLDDEPSTSSSKQPLLEYTDEEYVGKNNSSKIVRG